MSRGKAGGGAFFLNPSQMETLMRTITDGGKQPSPPDIPTIRATVIQDIKRVLEKGCEDEKHARIHHALSTVIRESFQTDVMPERTAEVFCAITAEIALHRSGEDGLATLFAKNAEVLAHLFYACLAVGLAYEESLGPRPRTPGQYL